MIHKYFGPSIKNKNRPNCQSLRAPGGKQSKGRKGASGRGIDNLRLYLHLHLNLHVFTKCYKKKGEGKEKEEQQQLKICLM